MVCRLFWQNHPPRFRTAIWDCLPNLQSRHALAFCRTYRRPSPPTRLVWTACRSVDARQRSRSRSGMRRNCRWTANQSRSRPPWRQRPLRSETDRSCQNLRREWIALVPRQRLRCRRSQAFRHLTVGEEMCDAGAATQNSSSEKDGSVTCRDRGVDWSDLLPAAQGLWSSLPPIICVVMQTTPRKSVPARRSYAFSSRQSRWVSLTLLQAQQALTGTMRDLQAD